MRISDWSSDVCSSDLIGDLCRHQGTDCHRRRDGRYVREEEDEEMSGEKRHAERDQRGRSHQGDQDIGRRGRESQTEGEARNGRHDEQQRQAAASDRSEEHTSELQSLMRISYAVSCLKKKK